MHYHEPPRPDRSGRTHRCYLSPLHGPQELVLNCQIGDRVQINDSLEVVVLDVCGDEVVLGVDDEFDVVPPFINEG